MIFLRLSSGHPLPTPRAGWDASSPTSPNLGIFLLLIFLNPGRYLGLPGEADTPQKTEGVPRMGSLRVWPQRGSVFMSCCPCGCTSHAIRPCDPLWHSYNTHTLGPSSTKGPGSSDAQSLEGTWSCPSPFWRPAWRGRDGFCHSRLPSVCSASRLTTHGSWTFLVWMRQGRGGTGQLQLRGSRPGGILELTAKQVPSLFSPSLHSSDLSSPGTWLVSCGCGDK